MHSPPSELLLLVPQLCLRVLNIPGDVIYNAGAQTVPKQFSF